MDSANLLEQYARGLGSTGALRNHYLSYARDFLDYSEGRLDKETVMKYLKHIRQKRHLSDGSVNFIYRVIRTLFKRNGLDWPFTRGEAPSIREDKVQAPALDPDIVVEMIEAAKRQPKSAEATFLSLATVYGLRRVEMVNLQAEDVNLADRTLHIATAKHGRDRTHMIPEEIIPYLKHYDFSRPRTEFDLFTLWYMIEKMVNLEHVERVSWHAVRRTVDTLLLDRLPDTVVMSFLRWKQRTSGSMPYRYSAQRFVGRGGIKTRVVGEALEVDEKVFAVHPFLKHWR
jgi:integrase